MAISATFRADFSSFLQQVQKAEVQLRSFETGAGKVEKSLARMTDSFSGRRLIQEATLMTEAIDRVGGVSTLTGRELQMAGEKAQQAAEKMKRLGIDVPPGLQKIAEHAAPIPGMFAKMIGVLAPLGAAVGVGFSAAAVVNFGKALLTDADALVKLSDKTGVSIDGLQRFRRAGADAGNTLDEITSSVTQMQNRLASGDQSAIGALDRLGLKWSELKSLAPDQQFIAISDAIRKIHDPARQVVDAMDLFGRTGASVLPTIKRGFDDLKGSLPTDEQVRALDDFGDAIGRWAQRGLDIVTEEVGTTILSLERLGSTFGSVVDVIKGRVPSLATSLATLKPFAKALVPEGLGPIPLTDPRVKAAVAALEGDLKQSNTTFVEANKRAEEYATALENVMASTKHFTTSITGLDTALVDNASAALKAGVSVKDVALAFHLTEREVEALKQQLKFTDSVVNQSSKSFLKLGVHLGDVEAHANEFRREVRGIEPDLRLASRSVDLIGQGFKPLPGQLRDATHGFGSVGAAALQAGQDFQQLKADAFESADGIVDIFEQLDITGTIQRAFEGGGDVFKSIGASIGKMIGHSITTSMSTTVSGAPASKGMQAAGLALGTAFSAGFSTVVTTAINIMSSRAERQLAILAFDQAKRTFITDLTGIAPPDIQGWARSSNQALVALARQADRAGASIEGMLRADSMAEFTLEAEKLRRALDFQEDAMQQLDDAVQRYGFDLASLGPAFAGSKLSEQAQQLYKDFQLLSSAGVDHNEILSHMAPTMKEYIETAKAAGVAVPLELKNMIEEMIRLGQITKEDGTKFENAEDAGITFADSLNSIIQDELIPTIEALTEAIKLGLGGAMGDAKGKADGLTSAIDRIPKNVDVDVNFWEHRREALYQAGQASEMHTGGIVRSFPPEMHMGGVILPFMPKAHAGLAVDEVPIIAQRGEGILSRRDMEALGGSTGFEMFRRELHDDAVKYREPSLPLVPQPHTLTVFPAERGVASPPRPIVFKFDNHFTIEGDVSEISVDRIRRKIAPEVVEAIRLNINDVATRLHSL